MLAFGGHYHYTDTRLLQDAKRLKRASTAKNTRLPVASILGIGETGTTDAETETDTDKTARSLR